MNETKYKEVFSKVHPSDETVERIFEMTNKKNNKSIKTLAVVMALIAVLFSLGIAAYASTDGEIIEAVSEVAEEFSKKIILLVNENETEANVEISEILDENGNYLGIYTIISSTTTDSFEYAVEDTDKRMMEFVEDYIEISITEE